MLNLNQPPKTYSVKYVDGDGIQHLAEVEAVGTSDAMDKARAQFPNCNILQVYRKT